MGPVNKHPATPPPPLQSSPPRLVGVERLYESQSSQVSVQLHTRTHACLHTHMHTRACFIHSAVALDTLCLCTGGHTCTDRTSAAAALCAWHTPPHEEPRTTAVKALSPNSWTPGNSLRAFSFSTEIKYPQSNKYYLYIY